MIDSCENAQGPEEEGLRRRITKREEEQRLTLQLDMLPNHSRFDVIVSVRCHLDIFTLQLPSFDLVHKVGYFG